jgi:arsenical pump membrane protein
LNLAMPFAFDPTLAIWGISLVATSGVIFRPWRLPEAVWAMLGAAALVLLGLFPYGAALRAMAKGTDVYLFLIGMMLVAELARREGLFDWMAAHAARTARGSAKRLFALIYGVGIVVTVFLSNDATAVVLTPAIYAAARAARAEPLPYLLICAFIANAASFVLPISNPANLVIFREQMPPLMAWLERFTLPSVLAIAVTYVALLLTQRQALRSSLNADVEAPALAMGGRIVACGIAAMTALLIAASAAGLDLGLPTFLAGVATAMIVLLRKREAPWATLRHISWSVLPLVAGLFVLVEAVQSTGLLQALTASLRDAASHSVPGSAWGAGIIVALASNVMNNLPVGLLAGSAMAGADVPDAISSAILIGVDLGPNLSATGSLATILWLVALRREGVEISALRFLKIGAVVMFPALVAALAALVLTSA